MAKKFVKIGSILKPVGTRGEMKTDIPDEFLEDFVNAAHVFILINGSYVPYFIESVRETNQILVKFEEMDDPEEAATISLKDLYMEEKNITSSEFANQKDKEQLLDFAIYSNNENIGTIIAVEIFPQQIMAVVQKDAKPFYLPLIDQFIVEINDKNKIIYMDLPEGILDI
jgi:16S rRNA processing protein RimM